MTDEQNPASSPSAPLPSSASPAQEHPDPGPHPAAAATKKTVPEKNRPAKPEPVRARLSAAARLALTLALLLSFAALGGAGYLFYLQKLERMSYTQDQMNLTSQISERGTQITALKNELQQATQQLAQDRAALIKANESRTQLQGRMAALEKDIAQVTGSHRIDWMLKEVEHFIFVAERRLSLLGDTAGALALLQEADDIARAMQEPAVRPLRDALVKDMHSLTLAAETSIDTDGLFLRIDQLVDRVPALNIPRYELYQESPGASSAEPLPDNGLPLFWRRFTDFIRSLVRFQKHEKAKPLLLTAERDYLAQSIVLLLEQSQLALLRGDTQAYRLSLTEARRRVDTYIHLQTQESKLFLSELDALAQIKLRPPVPGIQDSVRAVQVFREFWAREKIEREQLLQKIGRQSAAASPAPAAAQPAAPATEAKP